MKEEVKFVFITKDILDSKGKDISIWPSWIDRQL